MTQALLKSTVRKITDYCKRHKNNISGELRYKICLLVLNLCENKTTKLSEFDKAIKDLVLPLSDVLREQDVDERHYWIGTLYAQLLTTDKRREQATYFTPPPVVSHLLHCIENANIDLTNATLIDPAAGGAAFLSSIAGRMHTLKCDPLNILHRIRGIEIDEWLALLAKTLIEQRVGKKTKKSPFIVGDALKTTHSKKYDIVLVNPPYGRIFTSHDKLPQKFQSVVESGHINKYALFIALAIELAKPGGMIGIISPASYVAGPLYHKLRAFIREQCNVQRVDMLERDRLFLDVSQDTCVAILHKKKDEYAHSIFSPQSGILSNDGQLTECGTIKEAYSALDAPWVLPFPSQSAQITSAISEAKTFSTLKDYGCNVKAGYFVWNREKERLLKRYSKGCIPLIWAKNVKPGVTCIPAGKAGNGIDYVKFEQESTAIIRSSAIVLQRTTNNRQPRRLIAALVDKKILKQYGGVVTENHTLVILPAGKDANLSIVCKLLNSKAVDARYRQVAGTANVTASALRELPLPSPEALDTALKLNKDFDTAVEQAYQDASSIPSAMEAVA